MNKKILAAVFSMALLCSCGKENIEELSETGSESVSLASGSASETTVTTTAAETTSEAVSEETEIAAEVSEAEEKVPITRDFFNDDVVWEEVMLPVKIKYYHYKNDGTEDYVVLYEYEYDAAGNEIKGQSYTSEYDYNPDGTYNSVSKYLKGELDSKTFYDENGWCIASTYTTITTANNEYSYEYEFDDAGRLIRKKGSRNGKNIGTHIYTYDEEGRLYTELNDNFRLRYEYGDGFENVYYFRDEFETENLWKVFEKDKNGNIIKETVNTGIRWSTDDEKTFTEYKYDDMNRLIYENHTVSDNYYDPDHSDVYLLTYEYDGDKIKKETNLYSSGNHITEYFYDENGRLVKEFYIFETGAHALKGDYPKKDTTEYFYNEDGTIISQTHNMDGVLIGEAEYAMIPKIVTDIEYKYYDEVNP